MEDDNAVRDSLCLLLRVEGYAVRDYASAEAFLADTDGRDAACLLLDLHMGGLSGLGLLEHLRRLGINTPAILMTANDEHLQMRGTLAGALAILRKPPDTDEMLQWIEQACRLTAS